jgi:hypothetical protein
MKQKAFNYREALEQALDNEYPSQRKALLIKHCMKLANLLPSLPFLCFSLEVEVVQFLDFRQVGMELMYIC